MKKDENVLYTDGHDVVVTSSSFRVKKKWYNLSGITRHGLSILKPLRIPGFSLLISGALLEVAGAARWIPAGWLPEVEAFSVWISTNRMAMIMGFVMLLLGAAWMWFMHERYALSITTAEGEKNVVVSRHKEYISQIVHALNEALFARMDSSVERAGKKREFIVSGR